MLDCCVCLSSLKNKYIELECGHRYHAKCINRWVEVKKNIECPLCKRSTTYKNRRNTRSSTFLLRFDTFIEKYFYYIDKIIKSRGQKKLIIFEKLLKLIKNNKYVLKNIPFKNNLEKCLEEARKDHCFYNYDYWRIILNYNNI